MSDLTRFPYKKHGFKPVVIEGDLVEVEGHESPRAYVPSYVVGLTDEKDITFVLEDVVFVPRADFDDDGFHLWTDAIGKAETLVKRIKDKGIVNLTLWGALGGVN